MTTLKNLLIAGDLAFHPGKKLTRSRARLVAAAALAAAVATTFTGNSALATEYSWSYATSGLWTSSSMWLPTGYPNAVTDNATIAATGAAYTVTQNTNITVGSLTLNSGSATLLNSAGVFTFTNAFLDAGTYTLNGGTMSGGLITLAGGTLNVQNGALSNITVTGGDLRVNNSVHILGTLSIANTRLDLAASSTVFFQGQSVNNLTITPTSTAAILPEIGGVATLTLGPGVLVHGGIGFNDDFPGDGLVNNGVINGDSATYSTAINNSKFTNNGTVEASNGGSITVGSNATTWINTGAILAAAGSRVNLGGTITLSSAGTLNGTAGTISISGGTLNNLGSTLNLNANTGNLFVNNSGTINGGTINETGGATLNVQSGNLVNLAVTGGDLNVTGTARVIGTLSIADTKLDLAANSTVYFQGQTVDNLTITPASTAAIQTEIGGVATLTLGPGVLVHGGVGFNDDLPGDGLVNNGVINGDSATYSTAINNSKFTNNGTVEASNGGSITVGSNATTWTNAGTLLAATGSRVNLGGTITLSSAGTLNGTAGSISINGGTLNNVGSTLNLNANTGNLFVNNSGTINGGTINETGGATLNVQSGNLVNVAITGGDLNVTSSAHVLGTLTIADHNLDLGPGATLYFQGQTADNLNITSPTYASIEAEIGGAATLTLGSGVTVHGGVAINNDISDGLINNGVINADNPSYAGGVFTSYFTNNGTFEATNGASITIGSATTLTNTGRLYVNNGTMISSNTINVGSGSLGGTGTISSAVSLGSSSSLAFNLGGATKGTGYDSLLFRGNLSLGGSLELFLINGFVPTASQTFTIVTMGSGTISNSFLNVANGGLLETAGGNGAFTVNISANQITLSNFETVPEPAGAAVLGVAAIGLQRRRRRGGRVRRK